ncbi:preprotein translocase subunit SecA [Granulosicoccus sp. 3-233]
MLVRSLSWPGRCRYTEKGSTRWLHQLAQRTRALAELTPDQRRAQLIVLAHRMRHAAASDSCLDEALAMACLAVEESLQLVPRANQCLAARAMLRGYLVEMATGEGKTLSVALAASAAALSATPVHVMTANEYLAERDAASMEALYRHLGLRVACALPTQDAAERRQAYAADIVYVTAKQVAFDWLNDSLQTGTEPDSLRASWSALIPTASRSAGTPLLRGLCLAIIDEADSLLVDEARIPLVLARAQKDSAAADAEAVVALGLAEQLLEGTDFIVQSSHRKVQLTDSGRAELSRLAEGIAQLWRSSRYREESVGQALTALHGFERDRDYIVRDGSLELLDGHTGRALPDRRLPHGLHRMLELKEKCKTSPGQETVASLPFQQFFRRYIGLVGISGTLQEVSAEVHHVYDRLLVRIPSHRPSQRVDLPARVFVNRSTQLRAMVEDIQLRHGRQQPVLVCTRSVEQSLGVSAMLKAHGLDHQVLNAYQDAHEAAIVATAGQAGQITVATNMAGRGTDIPLGDNVAERGGLHVISLAFNDARRLDRQLAGRAARQGDPGSWQALPDLDDVYLKEAMPLPYRKLASLLAAGNRHRTAMVLIRLAQRRMEWRHRQQRRALYQSRETLERQLAYGGRRHHLS